MNRIPFITTALGLNIILNNESRLVPTDHEHYQTILDGLRAGNFEVVNLIDEKKNKLKEFIGEINEVDFQISHGELLHRGKPYENEVVTKQIFDMIDKGYSPQPLVRLLEKVESNPNPNSVKDFWTFMNNTGLAISDDGDALAFKYVTKVSDMSDGDDRKARLVTMGAEYTDSHSRKFDYTPGKIASVPRHECPYEPGNDCGVGLHIGDLSYVRNSSHILALKFSPADVTSIGTGESRKIRVARFQALHIVNPDHLNEAGYKEPVYSVKDGKMTYSDYQKQYAGKSPEGFVDNPSASHWGN